MFNELVSSSDSELRGGRGGKQGNESNRWDAKGDGKMNGWPTRHPKPKNDGGTVGPMELSLERTHVLTAW